MSITGRARSTWLAVGAGAALGVGGAVAAGELTDRAAGQSSAPVSVSARQLLINQRVSQAGVRRANEALKLLAPLRAEPAQPSKPLGWRGEHLSEALREGQPRWAIVAGNGSLVRHRGATAAARTAFGRYRVTFERSVRGCALSAAIAVTDPAEAVLVDRVPTLGLDAADPAVVTVRIYQASNPGNSEDAPFHLTALC